MPQPTRKLGLWLIGAGGNVATTVAVGLAALQKGLTPPVGLVTEAPPFTRLPLVSLRRIVVGGHEVGLARPIATAQELHRESGLFEESLLRTIAPRLRAWQANIRPGTTLGCGKAVERLALNSSRLRTKHPLEIVKHLRGDLRSFARRHRLDRVVVINVASNEPVFRAARGHRSWEALAKLLASGRSALPASSLYALAAIEEGMPYVNFTPSVGADLPALRERAMEKRVPIMGSDGKTGETLVRSVLAPLFRQRQLQVLSWAGYNILGNRDGQVLASPSHRAAKLKGKNIVISSLVGDAPETTTSIEYVSSLNDWKTAWDHVHFRGFLGVKMSLQFTWQGCDSILAAPLVIDLARLADLHAHLGLAGEMRHLACFFKTPMDVHEHAFSEQMRMLEQYVIKVVGRRGAV